LREQAKLSEDIAETANDDSSKDWLGHPRETQVAKARPRPPAGPIRSILIGVNPFLAILRLAKELA
jgi:hypothetical protein